ncbi:CRE-EIF-3.K protein [Caenorhabditis remanei]|uniref:Eukaryotic translation initiation factor 3 subunit K n=1 Tax=Caenorhabditis remanei TaxID=31234 RepID=E3LTY7_CAERE|nr:CRE-EIF-3.K protein [Caenorhabditis remanei]
MSFERLQRDLHEAIEGVNRYNPENVSDLAACVQAMVAENKYDKDIVLTILKLYQLNPEKYDEAVVRQVLLKTLMVLPSSDFALAKCLIDTNRLGSQELRRIFDLGAVLESCNFAVFWKLMKGTYKPSTNTTEPFKVPSEIPKMVKNLVGFEDSIKHCKSNFTRIPFEINDFSDACRVISVTFQNIEKKLLSRLLGGASDKEVTALAKKFGWEAKENGDVFFVANHEGTIKTRNIDEKIQFSHVADLLTSIQPPLTH